MTAVSHCLDMEKLSIGAYCGKLGSLPEATSGSGVGTRRPGGDRKNETLNCGGRVRTSPVEKLTGQQKKAVLVGLLLRSGGVCRGF
jgi:hypothetical protein